MNPLIFTMCSTKFRSSGILVIKLLFDQLVLILFYAVYVIYYAIITFFKAIWHHLVDLAASLGSCNARCIKSVGKYDSLNDVVIKVTLTNNNEANGKQNIRDEGGEEGRCDGGLWGEDRRFIQQEREGDPSGVSNDDSAIASCKDISSSEFSINNSSIIPDNRTSETML
jgi:hypothetical protein